jgi:hypothetical protein
VVNVWDRNDRSIDHSSIDRDTYFTARDKNEGEFIRVASTKSDIFQRHIQHALLQTSTASYVMYVQVLYIRFDIGSAVVF